MIVVKGKDDKNIDKQAYFDSRAQIVINPNNFIPNLQLYQQQLLNGIAVLLSEGSGWTIKSTNEHYIKEAEHSFGSLWVYVICQIMARERLQLTS